MRPPRWLLVSVSLAVAGCSDESTSGSEPRDGGAESGRPAGGRSGTGGARATTGGTAGSGGAPAAGGASSGGAPGTGGTRDASTDGADAASDGSVDANDGGPSTYCPLADYAPRTCREAGACGEEEECFRGVCLRTCGTSLAYLESTLGTAVQPVATLCNARARLYTSRARRDGACTRVDVFGYRISGTVGDEVTWAFRSYEVDPFLVAPAPGRTATGTFQSPGGNPFFQSFPTLNPSGTELGSFIYYQGNTTNPSPMVLDIASTTVEVGDAFARLSQFRGHDWLDDDRWLVAQIFAGAGRFDALDPQSPAPPVPVLTGFGDSLNALRVLQGVGVVLAGKGQDELFVIDVAHVRAVADGTVASPIDVTTDVRVQRLTGPFLASFRAIGETHLATGQGNFGDPLQVQRMTWSGKTLALGPPETLLLNDQAFEGHVALTADLVYLPQSAHALIARWTTP